MIKLLAVAAFLALQAPALAQTTPIAAEAHRAIPGQIRDLHHRWIIPGAEYPWSAVGRLTTEAGYCTGAMIGRRLALTAAHCLWSKNKRVATASLRFAVGYQDGTFMASTTVDHVHVAPGFDGSVQYSAEQAMRDWAILELKNEIGTVSGYLGIERFDQPAAEAAARDGLRFDRAGFGFEHRGIALSRGDCGLAGTTGTGQIVHECHTIKGDSGSPLFHKVGDGFLVVAVAVYTHAYSGGSLGGAVATEAFAGLTARLGASARGNRPSHRRVASR